MPQANKVYVEDGHKEPMPIDGLLLHQLPNTGLIDRPRWWQTDLSSEVARFVAPPCYPSPHAAAPRMAPSTRSIPIFIPSFGEAAPPSCKAVTCRITHPLASHVVVASRGKAAGFAASVLRA
eukprot:scaffold86420_cov32-Tisochrysis_lutea.AAC.1